MELVGAGYVSISPRRGRRVAAGAVSAAVRVLVVNTASVLRLHPAIQTSRRCGASTATGPRRQSGARRTFRGGPEPGTAIEITQFRRGHPYGRRLPADRQGGGDRRQEPPPSLFFRWKRRRGSRFPSLPRVNTSTNTSSRRTASLFLRLWCPPSVLPTLPDITGIIEHLLWRISYGRIVLKVSAPSALHLRLLRKKKMADDASLNPPYVRRSWPARAPPPCRLPAVSHAYFKCATAIICWLPQYWRSHDFWLEVFWSISIQVS